MNVLRQRGKRFFIALFFAALVLVPLLESGHTHANGDLAKPCAVCVMAHHSPAAQAQIVLAAALTHLAPLAISTVVAPPARCDHSPQSGRAPPFALHSLVA
jgi:hypothetical protein